MITGQELDKGMRTLKSIWVALFVSLILYVFSVPLIIAQSQVILSQTAYGTLRMTLYGVAVVTLAATWYVRTLLLLSGQAPAPQAKTSPPHPAIGRYTTIMILALGMSETIGVYGLILFILGNNKTDLYLLTALSAAAMTLYFPRKEEIVRLADKFSAPS